MTLIILVTYNGEFWIENCIESLIREPNSDIFVIDCNSSDRTREILAGYKNKLTLHFSNKNLGFGKANNVGLRYALENGYNYVFLVNQDTVCTEGIINKLKTAYHTHPEYGILSPLHFYSKELLDSRFEWYLKKSQTQTFSTFLSADEVIPIDFVNAAFWFIPIDVIKELGGFDPIFQHYGEDVDYANRVKINGKEIGIVKHGRCYHLRNQNMKESHNIRRQINDFKIKFLIILNDPVYTKMISLIKFNAKAIRYFFSSIIRLKFYRLFPILIAYLYTYSKIPSIFKNRNIYKKQGYKKIGFS